MHLSKLAIAIAALVTSAASVNANAVVVNISATTLLPTSLLLGAGTYNVNWIDNTANGGYAGWSAYSANTSWREAFIIGFNGQYYTVDKQTDSHYVQVAGSTPANALAAFQSGPYSFSADPYVYPDTVQSFYDLDAPQFTLQFGQVVTFGIPDGWVHDNTGGVSLEITAAVPEPQTYALMLAGLGAIGLLARRRKSAAR